MEKCKIIFCELCLNVIIDGNFKVVNEFIKEVVGDLFLKLSAEESHERVMCSACYRKLFAAFNFKVTCMDTENSIFPYVNSENVTPVDLREIYLKLRGKEHLSNVVVDERICRLCMQFITNEFKAVGEIDTEMIQKYIPEINFNSTINPVICSLCVDLLNTHSSFLKSCLYIQEKTANVDDNCTTESPSYIKCENIDVKTEECDEYGGTSFQSDNIVDDTTKVTDSTNVCGRNETLDLTVYQCETCDFKTKYKRNLLQHYVTHKDFSEVQVFKCDACNFKTKRRDTLRRHQLRHKNFTEVKMHMCDQCDYRTKVKDNLMRHQLRHKDFSEVQIYKCDKCDFKTKRKSNLITHQLRHKDFSEVQVYKCDVCDFKTKHKGSLVFHQQKHKTSKVQMFTCDQCNFKTKHINNLAEHQMKHRDSSNVQVYKCDKCDFKTKFKRNLTAHQLKHKDISEVQVYMCDACDYKTKYKSSMTSHQVTHKDFSEIQIYKCEKCDFSTKHRYNLRRHQQKHKDLKITSTHVDTS